MPGNMGRKGGREGAGSIFQAACMRARTKATTTTKDMRDPLEGTRLVRGRVAFQKVCSPSLRRRTLSLPFPRRDEQLCVLLVSPIFNHNEGTSHSHVSLSFSSLLSCKSQSAFVVWAVGGDLIASYLNRLSPFVMTRENRE